MKRSPRSKPFTLVVCTRNDGYEVSLEIGKVYVTIPDAKAGKYARIRVVDDEGEDYLYPTEYFLPITLSQPAQRAVAAA